MQLQKCILKCENHACIRIMIILYIPLTSKKCKFQPKISIFPGNKNPFFIKPTVVWVKIFETKNINFSGLRSSYNRLTNRIKLMLPVEKYFKTLKDMIIGTKSFTVFQSGWNSGVKLWTFDEYSVVFPDKVTPDIYFTDEAVVQCDVPEIKILFRY